MKIIAVNYAQKVYKYAPCEIREFQLDWGYIDTKSFSFAAIDAKLFYQMETCNYFDYL